MSISLKNYKLNELNEISEITFTNMPLCFCNSLRRILLSEIPIVAIDIDNITGLVTEKIPIHNEYITQRIGLIPIRESMIIKQDDGLITSKWANNKRTYVTRTTQQFNIKEEMIKVKKYFYIDKSNKNEYPFINACGCEDINNKSYIMKINDELSKIRCEAMKLKVGCGNNNSRFSPVSYISWDFDPIEGNQSSANQSHDEKERQYKLNSSLYKGDPQKIIMALKSNHMEPDRLFYLSLNILKRKLLDILEYKIDNNELCYFDDSSYKYDSIIMVMKGENDTIGNLLSTMGKYYLIDTKRVLSYISYKITHPLENDIVIKLSIAETEQNDIFEIARKLDKSFDNNDDESRLKLYKELCKEYIKNCIDHILKTFLGDVKLKEYFNTDADKYILNANKELGFKDDGGKIFKYISF